MKNEIKKEELETISAGKGVAVGGFYGAVIKDGWDHWDQFVDGFKRGQKKDVLGDLGVK